MTEFLVIVCLASVAAAVVLAMRLARCRREFRDESAALRQEAAAREDTLAAERDLLLDALNDAFLLIDPGGKVISVNRPALELFRGREIVGRSLDEVFIDERLAAPIREAVELGANVTREIVFPGQASPLGPDGQGGETAWLIDAGPVDHDRPHGAVRVIIRDMTAEHQSDQVRKDFVANASHELRTPLSIIGGYIENLLDDGVLEDTGTARRFLQTMQKHGTRLSRIVEDMLVISRLESGEASGLNVEPFAFQECVQDVLERLEPVIDAQRATVKAQLPAEGLVVIADRFYWTQILFNLVENALKQNPRIPLKVEIGGKRTGKGKFKVWVSDNGVGIPGADLPHIFRRFYRVEKHHSQTEIKGTGLGLSIVKRAVEAHHGEIKVTSTPGKRTTFAITLPPASIADPGDEDEPVSPPLTD